VEFLCGVRIFFLICDVQDSDNSVIAAAKSGDPGVLEEEKSYLSRLMFLLDTNKFTVWRK
jgi:hypothetical protein